MQIDLKGTPIFPGAIVAFPFENGRAHSFAFAIVLSVDETRIEAERLSLTTGSALLKRVDFISKGSHPAYLLVIHPFHYSEEMRAAVLEWEENNSDLILGEGMIVSGELPNPEARAIAAITPDARFRGHDLGSLTREGAKQLAEQQMRAHSDCVTPRAFHRLADDGGPALD